MREAFAARWVSGRHNQCPGLYCSSTAGAAASYPPAQLATIHESSGGGNVRFYFCAPDGRVLHGIFGYWEPGSLLAEEAFARQLLDRPADAAALRASRRAALARELAALDPRSGRATAARLRALDDLPFGRPITEVLATIEDDIYRRGAIG